MPEAQAKRLNVVFHGSQIFSVNKDGITVVMPKSNGHANYAGSWTIGGIQPLNAGTYSLKGVQVEEALDDMGKDIVSIKAPLVDPPADAVQWKLPFPKKITLLQRFTKFASNLGDDKQAGATFPKLIPSVVALTYESDGTLFTVQNLNWWKDPGDPEVNLHIYAEETNRWKTAQEAKSHAGAEFDSLTKLLDLKSAGLPSFSFLPNEIPLIEPNIDLPSGLRNIELISLATLMPYMGLTAARKDDANLPLHPCIPAQSVKVL